MTLGPDSVKHEATGNVQHYRKYRRSGALALLTLGLALLSGCVLDQDYTPVVMQFQQASNSLAQSFEALLA
ncbi:MAG: hypothetical protein J0G35_10350, partial [Acidobacteriales bacterium]|nr:hypothetical protein [Terriglobales bacterium]